MNNKIQLCVIFIVTFFFTSISVVAEDLKKGTLSIETYLNSIQTLQADFIQISSTGEVETGEVLIKKPGQMRFEYDPPSNHIVMASGLLLVIIDKKSTGEPQRYLTSQTPISYLLNENITLKKNSNLLDTFVKGDNIHILFNGHKNSKSGQLELVFSQDSTRLKEWTITNYSGEKTRVLLEKIIVNKPINKKLFNIGREISKAKRHLMLN